MKEWRTVAFQLCGDDASLPAIDLFAHMPFGFDAWHAIALTRWVSTGVQVPIASFDTLISMKEQAGRAKALEDIRIPRKA